MDKQTVDVLGLLDAYIAHGIPQERPELIAARSAVSKLVEALRMSDEWIREAVNFGGCKLKSEQTLFRNSQALKGAGASA